MVPYTAGGGWAPAARQQPNDGLHVWVGLNNRCGLCHIRIVAIQSVDTRERILRAARALFFFQGIFLQGTSKTSLDGVARWAARTRAADCAMVIANLRQGILAWK